MHRRGLMGILAVLCLVATTLYMAFAFPYTLLHLKQSETTEIKAVIVIARNGERSPRLEDYFIGEEPSEKLLQFGHDQLTNTGKERMYLLGKYLKMKYYNLLLNGNPRKVYARSSDLERSLESTQALLAGLNPPRDEWTWASGANEIAGWQPKAIHSADPRDDDLLSSESTCFRFDTTKAKWKNSTRYQQLINEFRHDLQNLRQNTGLEFEDDLEMLTAIEDSLKTRLSFDEANVPGWYTSTFASRLAHIADATTVSRFSEPESQRLYAGRLLHEIVERINGRIKVDRSAAIVEDGAGGSHATKGEGPQQARAFAPAEEPIRLAQNQNQRSEPNMFIYMTDKQHLSALMNSLQVYSSQPLFGSLLLIELHHDPINSAYFLRLFTLSSESPNVLPEPVRVNPIACVDSAECEPQQFEQNIRHLTLDKSTWQTICLEQMAPQQTKGPTTTTTTMKPVTLVPVEPNDSIRGPSTVADFEPTTPTRAPDPEVSTSADSLEKLDDELIVGPSRPTQRPVEDASTIETLAATASSSATTTNGEAETQGQNRIEPPDQAKAPIARPILEPTIADETREKSLESLHYLDGSPLHGYTNELTEDSLDEQR